MFHGVPLRVANTYPSGLRLLSSRACNSAEMGKVRTAFVVLGLCALLRQTLRRTSMCSFLTSLRCIPANSPERIPVSDSSQDIVWHGSCARRMIRRIWCIVKYGCSCFFSSGRGAPLKRYGGFYSPALGVFHIECNVIVALRTVLGAEVQAVTKVCTVCG